MRDASIYYYNKFENFLTNGIFYTIMTSQKTITRSYVEHVDIFPLSEFLVNYLCGVKSSGKDEHLQRRLVVFFTPRVVSLLALLKTRCIPHCDGQFLVLFFQSVFVMRHFNHKILFGENTMCNLEVYSLMQLLYYCIYLVLIFSCED